jgi:hypothetical protein
MASRPAARTARQTGHPIVAEERTGIGQGARYRWRVNGFGHERDNEVISSRTGGDGGRRAVETDDRD